MRLRLLPLLRPSHPTRPPIDWIRWCRADNNGANTSAAIRLWLHRPLTRMCAPALPSLNAPLCRRGRDRPVFICSHPHLLSSHLLCVFLFLLQLLPLQFAPLHAHTGACTQFIRILSAVACTLHGHAIARPPARNWLSFISRLRVAGRLSLSPFIHT